MEWTLLKSDNITVGEFINIFEDSSCYGFEFKVENGNIYFREVC